MEDLFTEKISDSLDKPAMVIELKWNQKAETAIQQIKEKKYDGALKGYTGRVLLVGVSYEKGKRGERGKAHTCVIEEQETVHIEDRL